MENRKRKNQRANRSLTNQIEFHPVSKASSFGVLITELQFFHHRWINFAAMLCWLLNTNRRGHIQGQTKKSNLNIDLILATLNSCKVTKLIFIWRARESAVGWMAKTKENWRNQNKWQTIISALPLPRSEKSVQSARTRGEERNSETFSSALIATLHLCRSARSCDKTLLYCVW